MAISNKQSLVTFSYKLDPCTVQASVTPPPWLLLVDPVGADHNHARSLHLPCLHYAS